MTEPLLPGSSIVDVERVALADLKADADAAIIRSRSRRARAARRRARGIRAGIVAVALGAPAAVELARILA